MAGKRRSPEIIAGRVNADGTIAAGDGFTVVKASTGNYDVTIAAPGFRLVGATAAPGGTAYAIVGNTGWANNTFRVVFLSSGLGAIDAAFAFIAVGVQT